MENPKGQRAHFTGETPKPIPYGKGQTFKDIHDVTCGTAGGDPYIENPAVPPIKPDRINSTPMAGGLAASEGGSGKGAA